MRTWSSFVVVLTTLLPAVSAAPPQILSHKGDIEKVCMRIDMGQGVVPLCFWGMNVAVTFDQDIYVCDASAGPCASDGSMVRIDNAPLFGAGGPGALTSAFPLHVSTMGAFRIGCSKTHNGLPAYLPPWTLRGESQAGPSYHVMRNDGDTSTQSLPEITSAGVFFEDGLAKCQEILVGKGESASAVQEGCTGQPDWSPAPWGGNGQITNPWDSNSQYKPYTLDEGCTLAHSQPKYVRMHPILPAASFPVRSYPSLPPDPIRR